MHPLTKVWHPALYQDGRTRRGYFEGWYFKATDTSGARTLAIIPGVSIEPAGRRHAFVQVMRDDGLTHWFDLPWEEFSSATNHFDIRVGGATYTGARLASLSHSAGAVEFALEDSRLRIEVAASGAVPGILRSPVLGRMVGQVEESLNGMVRVRLIERAGGREVFSGEGRGSGIELMDPARDLST